MSYDFNWRKLYGDCGLQGVSLIADLGGRFGEVSLELTRGGLHLDPDQGEELLRDMITQCSRALLILQEKKKHLDCTGEEP